MINKNDFVLNDDKFELAQLWVRNQFNNGDFPFFGIDNYLDKNNQAEVEFLCLFTSKNSIQDWCVKYLNDDQWALMLSSM